MLSVKELRALASSLDQASFKRQLGPFALIQQPHKGQAGAPAQETAGGLEETAMARPDHITQGILSLLFQFEDLLVATLPPLEGVDELTVGRLPDCDLVLDDPSVSKRHAVVVWDEAAQRCLLKDLGSRNGTYLNGNKLYRVAPVRNGDIISFGEVQFWYLHTDTLHERITSIRGMHRTE